MEPAQVFASEAAAAAALSGDSRGALVMALGRAYHQSGVPSDGLEEIMHRSARALDLELQVTALPTSIMAAVGPPASQRVVLLRLEPGAIDLGRLALLNDVFDRIVAGRSSAPAALAEVERIETLVHPVPPIFAIAAYCALSTGVSVVLGGHAHENLASFAIGIVVGTVYVLGRVVPTVDRLFEVLAGFFATIIVTLFAAAFEPLAVYIPIVAGVVQVLPGVQLTAALHELAFRNLVAGTSRLGSVLMTLLSLGCGFALGIAIVGPGALHATHIAYSPIGWPALAFAIVAVAVGISVLENARLRDYPWVLASCGVAEIAYRVFANSPAFQVATFAAALVVGIFANIGARYARIPQAVLLIPGVVIIVPGALSYESILFILQSDANDASSIALNAVIASVEIVSGLLLAQLTVAPRRRVLHPLRESS